ncbi:WD40 repeat-like protein [Linnemannia elongata AG-77]|uniref:WD40 repeat-like protein n=1 Tax=Linnemannia elongata AG-77 TaxID=1314771 RepID=A0A197JNP9_9FUNG|nr:WD40 repeat-like protein [Linnemannia elongata AG-77]
MDGVRFGELPYLEEHAAVNAVAFSPDGKLFAVALRYGSLITYDTTTWTRVHRHEEQSEVLFVAFSPNNRHLASGSEDMICRLWDTVSGETMLVMKGHTERLWSVAFSPCGKQIASTSKDRTIRLWSSETGECLFVLSGHENTVLSTAYSGDGRRLFSGSNDGTIRGWDPKTGTPEADWVISYVGASHIALSADGRQVAVMPKSMRGEIYLLDVITGEEGLCLNGDAGQLTCITFSPTGGLIVTSSWDKTVRLWDSSNGHLISKLSGHRSGITACAFSPDGLQIASGGYDGITRLWEVNTNQSSSNTQDVAAKVRTVAYSHDGLCIISYRIDDTIQRWNSSTGASRTVPSRWTADAWCFALSPNGHWFASGCEDGNIRLLNVRTDVVDRVLFGTTDCPIDDMSFSRCGRWLAACDRDGDTLLWDLDRAHDQGKVVGEMDFQLHSMDYSPDGQRLAISTSASSVLIWDLLSSEPDIKLEGHTDAVYSVAYSPCGKWILSGSNDKTARLWSDGVDSWSCNAVVGRCLEAVTSVAWNPVVPLEFVTGSDDGSVRVWRISGSEAGDVSVRMHWGSHIGRLCAADLNFKGAVGLSPMCRKLLVQRGAIDGSLLSKGDDEGSIDESLLSEEADEGSIAVEAE